MSKPTHVPKFGNWDANDHVPFTVVFEKARAGKGGTGGAGGGKIINPNDPSENPAAFGIKPDNPVNLMPPPKQPVEETGGRANSIGVNSIGSRRRASRDSQGASSIEGDSSSVEQSASHPAAYRARPGPKPGSSPLCQDKRAPTEGGTMHQPTNSVRPRFHLPSQVEETPDRSPALPRFGAWDEKDPMAGDGYTIIFNQARNEKKSGGPAHIRSLKSDPSPPPGRDGREAFKPSQRIPPHPAHRRASTWACCFQRGNAV